MDIANLEPSELLALQELVNNGYDIDDLQNDLQILETINLKQILE